VSLRPADVHEDVQITEQLQNIISYLIHLSPGEIIDINIDNLYKFIEDELLTSRVFEISYNNDTYRLRIYTPETPLEYPYLRWVPDERLVPHG
jgi:hypothetical protein